MSTLDDREAHRRFAAGYFTSLSVAGVRCFSPAQRLDLIDGDRPAKWTIILGENGVGKTTLLQCLSALAPHVSEPQAGALAGSYPRAFLASAELRALQRSGEPNLSMEADVESRGALSPYRKGDHVRNFIRISTPDSEIAKEHRADLGLVWARESGGGLTPVADLQANYYPDSTNVLCCGYGALRRATMSAIEGQPVTDAAASLFSDSVSLPSGEEWFLRADYAATATVDERTTARRDKVRAALIALLPDVTDIRVAGLDERPPIPRLDVLTPYGWVPMRALSLGYRSMVTWVVDLASRMFDAYPDSEDPLAEAAIALVDEIDLHIHPSWQRQITAHLDRLFPNVQFIATAHSPLIVQAEGVTNVAVLRRVDDHVEIINDPEQIGGWRVDQILTSDLFGLSSARPVEVERLLTRQQELVLLAHPTDEQRAELAAVDTKLADLAPGETAKDRETWAIVRRLADKMTAAGR